MEEPKLVFLHKGDSYKLQTAWFAAAFKLTTALRRRATAAAAERGIVATVRLLQK